MREHESHEAAEDDRTLHLFWGVLGRFFLGLLIRLYSARRGSGGSRCQGRRWFCGCSYSNPVFGPGTPLGYPHFCIDCAAVFTAATGVA